MSAAYDLKICYVTINFPIGLIGELRTHRRERLGHSTIALTLDVYSHVLPSMQAEAAAHLETMLYGKKSGEIIFGTPLAHKTLKTTQKGISKDALSY